MFEKKIREKQFISASFVERLFSDYKDTYPSIGLTRNIGVPALTNHEEVNAAMGPCTISHCPPKGGWIFTTMCHNVLHATTLKKLGLVSLLALNRWQLCSVHVM